MALWGPHRRLPGPLGVWPCRACPLKRVSSRGGKATTPRTCKWLVLLLFDCKNAELTLSCLSPQTGVQSGRKSDHTLDMQVFKVWSVFRPLDTGAPLNVIGGLGPSRSLVRLGPWSVWGLGPSRALVRLGPWSVYGLGPSKALVRLGLWSV